MFVKCQWNEQSNYVTRTDSPESMLCVCILLLAISIDQRASKKHNILYIYNFTVKVSIHLRHVKRLLNLYGCCYHRFNSKSCWIYVFFSFTCGQQNSIDAKDDREPISTSNERERKKTHSKWLNNVVHFYHKVKMQQSEHIECRFPLSMWHIFCGNRLVKVLLVVVVVLQVHKLFSAVLIWWKILRCDVDLWRLNPIYFAS